MECDLDDRLKAVFERYDSRIGQERAERSRPSAGARSEDERRADSLLAVAPETGRLINIIARSLAESRILEIGTSYGYSGMWLGAAARSAKGKLTTLEVDPRKSAYAQDMAQEAGLAECIDFQVGDALQLLQQLPGPWDFVLLDLWKDLYTPCLELVFPKLAPGAVIVADNMIRPGGPHIERYAAAVRAKPGVSSVLLPVGTGLEISRLAPAS